MKRAVISGGAGFVGRFIVEELLSEGYGVTIIGRTKPNKDFFSYPVSFVEAELGLNFDYQPVFEGVDAFVHAALDQSPDTKSYAFKNLGGTAALFKQAKTAGIERVIFLSDQDVYGPGEAGLEFYETDIPSPQSLHAKVKYEAEQILSAMNSGHFHTAVLRLSNVYGPSGKGRPHVWQALFKQYLTGQKLAPAVASYIHGEDVARAVSLMLSCEPVRMSGGIFNLTDMVVDQRDVLGPLKSASGCIYNLPDMGRFDQLANMNCDKMKSVFEWRTGGVVKLGMTLERLIGPYRGAA